MAKEPSSNDTARNDPQCVAFADRRQFASGPLSEVSLRVKRMLAEEPQLAILVFDALDGRQIDVDLRAPGIGVGSPSDEQKRKPGRPRLGVVPREVTLLPRHWDWLRSQPGGASAVLRRLVEQASRATVAADRVRQAREAAYRFMSAAAGNEPGFEEAIRALFKGDRTRFEAEVAGWPEDLRRFAIGLADEGLGVETAVAQ